MQFLQCSAPAVHSSLQHSHTELVLQLSSGTAGAQPEWTSTTAETASLHLLISLGYVAVH